MKRFQSLFTSASKILNYKTVSRSASKDHKNKIEKFLEYKFAFETRFGFNSKIIFAIKTWITTLT